MHFKNAVIFCALYFVTVAQSIGLNENQVNIIVTVFKDHEKYTDHISMQHIEKLGSNVGINNMSAFEYKQGVPDAKKLQALLVLLVINEKEDDDWKEKSLSSYEVRIIVGLFDKYDQEGNHDGLLKKDEVKKVIDGFNLDIEVKENIVNLFEDDDKTINSAELLQAFLAYKPKGRGVDKKQIQDLIDLHNKNKKNKHINPVEITEFLIKLSIVKEQHDEKLFFDPIPWIKTPLELQELLVVSAEYNKEKSEEVILFSVHFVKEVLLGFSKHDKDKDGVVCEYELGEYANIQIYYNHFSSLIKKFDTDHDGQLNIAEFFMVPFTINILLEETPEKV